MNHKHVPRRLVLSVLSLSIAACGKSAQISESAEAGAGSMALGQVYAAYERVAALPAVRARLRAAAAMSWTDLAAQAVASSSHVPISPVAKNAESVAKNSSPYDLAVAVVPHARALGARYGDVGALWQAVGVDKDQLVTAADLRRGLELYTRGIEAWQAGALARLRSTDADMAALARWDIVNLALAAAEQQPGLALLSVGTDDYCRHRSPALHFCVTRQIAGTTVYYVANPVCIKAEVVSSAGSEANLAQLNRGGKIVPVIDYHPTGGNDYTTYTSEDQIYWECGGTWRGGYEITQ